MTDAVGESLSALQDGEASELDLRRVLRELEQDDGLRERWARNQLISSAIKQEPMATAGCGFADRVRAELDSEPAARIPAWRSFFKPVASVAVAATVTMSVLTGTQLYQQAVSVDPETAVATEVAANQATSSTDFENFDNGSAPVAAGQFTELSLLASSSSSQQRAARGSYSTDALFNTPLRSNRNQGPSEADILAQKQLNQFLQNHVEHASFNSGVGLMPYARIGQSQEH